MVCTIIIEKKNIELVWLKRRIFKFNFILLYDYNMCTKYSLKSKADNSLGLIRLLLITELSRHWFFGSEKTLIFNLSI